MAEKSISYLARDFNDIKQELISFSEKYYPTLTTSFNDSSVGSWLIDLVAAVGDDLSYSIDRVYQENNVNSSKLRSSLLNQARMNGVKIPGPKASMVEIEISCVISVDATSNKPNWTDCPIIKKDTQVNCGSYVFELSEDVNFAEQFNDNGFSNRKFEPLRNSNGAITGYSISKTVMAVNGSSKVYKKVISSSELEPFMEVVLPEKNIMNIESVLFKSSANISTNPNLYEYYIDSEEFQITDEYVKTYRYFETDSLSELYRFGTETQTVDGCISGKNEVYVDYTETWEGDEEALVSARTTRVYKGKWKPISQKFITEYTDKGYLKMIFGSGSSDSIPSGSTYSEYIMSNIVNNSMLGVLPQAGWTMFVLYRVGGGVETNIAKNSINSIKYLDIVFPFNTFNADSVTSSLKVTNLSNSMAGKDAPSNEEIKYITKYSVGSQKRCVTLNDYKSRIAMMPPKYGCPFRYNAAEINNKIVVPFLGLTPLGKLDTALPSLLVDNLKEYMSGYKNITDYIEMKSGKVYNLGFEIDVFIDKNYTTEYVLKSMMDKIKDYMDVKAHMMGDEVFVGDLEKELNKLDGVIALIDFRVYNIWGGIYGSNAKFPLWNDSESCSSKITETFISPKDKNATCSRIDLEALDSVLENDYDSMFEILYPETDICIRCKLK